MLPELWQHISMANPILYIVNGFRYGLIGVTDVDVTLAVTMIIGFIVALISLSLYLLDKGIGIKQ
jgi:ABC-2 type transport system permease protein